MPFCVMTPNFIQIGPPIAEIWRHIDIQDGGRQPCCIYFGVMADHPRSVFHGMMSVLKPLVVPINSSRDIAMYKFWRFGLKLPIHAPFWGVFGGYFPRMTSPIVLTLKKVVLGRKHVVWPIQRVAWGNGTTWAQDREKKDSITKKSQKCYISPMWGEAPSGAIRPKSCMVGGVRDVMTYAKFQFEIRRVYDFTGGWIFDFAIDFWMGLTTV